MEAKTLTAAKASVGGTSKTIKYPDNTERPPRKSIVENQHLGADVSNIVVHGPVLSNRRSRRSPRYPARSLEHRGHADETQEPPPLPESRKRREHLEGETDIVGGVCEQPPRLQKRTNERERAERERESRWDKWKKAAAAGRGLELTGAGGSCGGIAPTPGLTLGANRTTTSEARLLSNKRGGNA